MVERIQILYSSYHEDVANFLVSVGELNIFFEKKGRTDTKFIIPCWSTSDNDFGTKYTIATFNKS